MVVSASQRQTLLLQKVFPTLVPALSSSFYILICISFYTLVFVAVVVAVVVARKILPKGKSKFESREKNAGRISTASSTVAKPLRYKFKSKQIPS